MPATPTTTDDDQRVDIHVAGSVFTAIGSPQTIYELLEGGHEVITGASGGMVLRLPPGATFALIYEEAVTP